jgi:hypothetical protein
MFTSIILLLPFLMVTFLPLALKTISSNELEQMGIQLECAEMPRGLFQRSNSVLPTITVVCGNA